MNDSRANPPTVILTIRWMARVWSIASIGLVLLMVVEELVYPHAPLPTLHDLVGLFFFPFGVSWG